MLGLTVDEAIVHSIEHARGLDGEPLLIKQVAALANIPTTRMYEIASGIRHAWACEVPLIVRATRHMLAPDAIERDLGRVGVLLPIVPLHGDPVIERAAEACRQFGEWMAKVGAAATDGNYSASEAAEARIEGDQVIAMVIAAVQQMEAAAQKKGRVA